MKDKSKKSTYSTTFGVDPIFKTNGVQYYHWISLSRRMYFFQLSYLLREIIVFLRTEIVCAEIGGKFTFTIRVGLPI